jgi:hypothetical protein
MSSESFVDRTNVALDRLINMELFNEDSPTEFRGRSTPTIVYKDPGVRLSIQIEESVDIAFGMQREDDLAKAGISGAHTDSVSFATELLKAIGGELSILDMENIVAVFSAELKVLNADRDAYIAEINGYREPSDEFVIYSPNEAAIGSGAGFWSLTAGWVDPAAATVFAKDEIANVSMPESTGQDVRWLNVTLEPKPAALVLAAKPRPKF